MMFERLLRAQAAQLLAAADHLEDLRLRLDLKDAALAQASRDLDRLRARLDLLEGRLEREAGPGQVIGTLTMPAELLDGFLEPDGCEARHPSISGLVCDQPHGHTGAHEGMLQGMDGGEVVKVWTDPPDIVAVIRGTEPDYQPDATPARPRCGARHPRLSRWCTSEPGHIDDHRETYPTSSGSGILCWPRQPDGEPLPIPEVHDGDPNPDLEQVRREAERVLDGEPPPEEWGPPAEARTGSASTKTPLARFRGRLRGRIRAYALHRLPRNENLCGYSQEVYEACKAAWYGDVTFAEVPKEGQVQVHGAWYLPGGPYSHRVGSMAWLQEATAAEFAAAADAVLEVERG
jgi:hypothetical protein